MKLKCLNKYAFVSIEYEMLEWPLWSLFLSHNKCHGFFSVRRKRAMSWVVLKRVSLQATITLYSAAAAKSPQSCPTLCDPIDSSPPGSPVPGILQARTLEWVAISFSNAWKWKWSRSVVSDSSPPHGLQPTRLLHPWDFPGKSTGVGCQCLLHTLYSSSEQMLDRSGWTLPWSCDF